MAKVTFRDPASPFDERLIGDKWEDDGPEVPKRKARSADEKAYAAACGFKQAHPTYGVTVDGKLVSLDDVESFNRNSM